MRKKVMKRAGTGREPYGKGKIISTEEKSKEETVRN